jgi:hypothetical protein
MHLYPHFKDCSLRANVNTRCADACATRPTYTILSVMA